VPAVGGEGDSGSRAVGNGTAAGNDTAAGNGTASGNGTAAGNGTGTAAGGFVGLHAGSGEGSSAMVTHFVPLGANFGPGIASLHGSRPPAVRHGLSSTLARVHANESRPTEGNYFFVKV
jgi:hypothetical protein